MWTCPKCAKKVDDTFEICWSCGTSVDGVEDPHFLDDADVRFRAHSNPDLPADKEQTPPESLVTLIKCSLAGEAHAIRVRLESEGIPVFLFDEFTITMDWLLSNAIGGVKVQVPEPFLERARTILGIVEQEQAAEERDEDEDYEEEADEQTPGVPEDGIIDRNVIEGIAKPPSDNS